MAIKLVKGDITTFKVDAIVNAANESLLGGGGVDGAIHKCAGPELLEECRQIGGCPTGEVRVTSAYNLPSLYVYHTVGPVWKGGQNNEETLLSGCYSNCLKEAYKMHIESLVFPNISTGIYSFPKEKAAKIAISRVEELHHNLEVTFCCFDDENFEIYRKILEDKNVI